MGANQYTATPPWTSEKDAIILSLWGKMSPADIGRQAGMWRHQVERRGRMLNLPRILLRDILAPTPEQWVFVASQKATDAGIRLALVVGHSRDRVAVKARWAAWKTLLDENPQYSVAGVARAGGFDHTAIRYAMIQMTGKTVREATYRSRPSAPPDTEHKT